MSQTVLLELMRQPSDIEFNDQGQIVTMWENEFIIIDPRDEDNIDYVEHVELIINKILPPLFDA